MAPPSSGGRHQAWRIRIPTSVARSRSFGLGAIRWGQRRREIIFYKPKPSFADSPGFLQIKHDSGLLLGLNCYHGERLPEVTGDVRSAHWNGRSTHWNLVCLRETDEGLLPVVQCAICRDYFRETWAGVLPFIRDNELRLRLSPTPSLTPDDLRHRALPAALVDTDHQQLVHLGNF